MKTSFKIIILIFVFLGGVSGILVFAKTQMAPPTEIDPINQYSKSLDNNFLNMDTVSDFNQCRDMYIKLDDKLNLFYRENLIKSEIADEFRKKINKSYGDKFINYSFNFFNKPVWPEDQIKKILSLDAELKNDKLINGGSAVTDDYNIASEKLNSVIKDYRDALSLSKKTSYNGIGDTSSKIANAKLYSSKEYLKNNISLVNALNSLPAKIAQSHYYYVNNLVNSLNGYYNVTKDYYMSSIIPPVDKAIDDYKKNKKIYENTEPDINVLEQKAIQIVTEAMNYYGD